MALPARCFWPVWALQGADPDEQLHVGKPCVGKPCVPALPLADCDPTAEIGDRVIDTPFERENGG